MKKFSLLFITYIIFSLFVIFHVFSLKAQHDFSETENRALETLASAYNDNGELKNWTNGEIQKVFENITSDQFPYREKFVKYMSAYELRINEFGVSQFEELKDSYFINAGLYYKEIGSTGYFVIGKGLAYDDEKNTIYENRIWNFEQIYYKYDDIVKHFYIYKPTEIIETDWFSDMIGTEHLGTKYYNDFMTRLGDKYTIIEQPLVSFEEYQRVHYKTDHHWNDIGAYEGYRDIINMISNDFPSVGKPAEVTARNCSLSPFYGSLSLKAMNNYGYDDFCDYTLSIEPNFTVTSGNNSAKRGDTVLNDAGYLYENYHGYNSDYLEITANHPTEDGVDILVIGDSFSKAIIDDLALHFNRLYWVDPRMINDGVDASRSMFSLDDFLAEHNVDAILWVTFYESLYFDSGMYLHIKLDY